MKELSSIKIKGYDIPSIFFYAGILLELIVSFTGYLFGGYGESIIIVLAMGCFCLSILSDMDIKRDILLFLVAGAYGMLCYYFQHSAFILRISLAILAGRRQDAKNVFKLFFYGTLIPMIVCGILSVFGMHNSLYVEEAFRSIVERRYRFGFFHPNGYALFLFRTVMMGFYVYIDRMKLPHYIISSVIAVAFTIPSKSKIGLAVLITGLVLFGICRFVSNKVTYILCIASTIFTVIFWFYIRLQDYLEVNDTMHNLWMFVDKVTTGRSGDSYYAMQNNTATLFGTGFGVQTSEMGLVDSIYCQGIIFMIILIITVIYMYIKMIKSGNAKGATIIAVTILYAVAESFLEYFNKNMIWMLCIGVVFALPGREDTNVKKDN